MSSEKTKLIEFAIAHWEKRWVCVPFFHLPEDTPNQNLEKIRPFLPEDYEPQLEIEEETRAYENINPIEAIVPWLWSKKDLQELCKVNNIPIGWVTNRFHRKPTTNTDKPNRRSDRKVPSLKGKDIQKILAQAKKLNKQHAIVLQILWCLNKSLSKTGTFVTLEEILRMQIRDISSHNDHGCNWINLYRRSVFGGHLVAFSLPGYLWKAARSQIDTKSLFLFPTKHGGPMHSLQVYKTLKQAASLSGVKEDITSLSLRPAFEKNRIERIAKRNRYNGPTNDHLREVTAKEWNAICHKIPEIQPSRGRRPQYTQLEALNAILHHLRTHCPLRKLPESFPNWKAVASQKRRWEKRGILQKILAHRTT